MKNIERARHNLYVSMMIPKSMSITLCSLLAAYVPIHGALRVFTTAIQTSESEKVQPNVRHEHHNPCPVQFKPFHFTPPYAYGGVALFHPVSILHIHLPKRLRVACAAGARAYGWASQRGLDDREVNRPALRRFSAEFAASLYYNQ